MKTLGKARKRLIGATAVLTLLLTACGGGSDDTPDPTNGTGGVDNPPPQSQTLTVAIQAWMADKLALDEMKARFESDNEGVTVNLVEYADNQALSTFALQWSQGHSDQDIVIVDGASTAVQFLQQDLIIDFNETDLFGGDLTKDKFVGESLKFTELDGQQFAIPIGLEVYNIAANRAILDEAGLIGADGSLPVFETWEDIYDAAKTITDATGQPGMTIQWGPNAVPTMFSVQQALRGDLYAADGTTLTFDTPEMREALEVWHRGAKEGVFTVDTFANKDAGRSNFNAGNLGMLLETASRAPESGHTIGFENIAILPMPGSLENGSFGFAGGIIVPTHSKNQELALKFIKEAVMSDAQVKAGEEWGKLPVLIEYFDMIDADWRDEMYDFVSKSVPAPMYRDLPKIQERGKQLLQEFLTGSGDVEAFIRNVEALIADSNLDS